nr:DUF1304 domain-containing protein [uncultured Moraxella sp.]
MFSIIGYIFATIATLIHLFIFYLEVIAFGSEKFSQTFKTKAEQHEILRPTFNNLGIYNLALAILSGVGMLFNILAKSQFWQGFSLGLLMAGLGVMAFAGLYLFATAPDKRKPAVVQCLPPLLAGFVLLLANV